MLKLSSNRRKLRKRQMTVMHAETVLRLLIQ